MSTPDKHICPHCGGDEQHHSHIDLEKAEKGEIKKVSKSRIPYTVVNTYENQFKSDFAKEIGDMGNSINKFLNNLNK